MLGVLKLGQKLLHILHLICKGLISVSVHKVDKWISTKWHGNWGLNRFDVQESTTLILVWANSSFVIFRADSEVEFLTILT